jgi:hypothetical protein
LLVKLHYYGIQGTVANWFRSWQIEIKKLKSNLRNFSQNGEEQNMEFTKGQFYGLCFS